MATSSSQDRNFLNDVIGVGLLETAIDWIKDNLNPEEVFDDDVLEKWAEDWALDNNYEKVKE